jgi:PDZ domain
MIPQPVIARFLKDVSDGRYDGVPRLGVRWQPLENHALKRRYEVSPDLTGVLVTGIYPGSPAAELLQDSDVLLTVDGHRIADDGTGEFRSGERTAFAHFIDSRQVGQEVAVSFLRQGQPQTGKVALRWLPGAGELIREEQYDSRPSYFIFGGVAFVPLTLNYLHAYGSAWYRDAPKSLLATRDVLPAEAGEQVVLIAEVLPAEVNEGYHGVDSAIVRQVDGVKPHDLHHVVELLERGESKFVTMTYGDGRRLVLDRAMAREANSKILKQYQIESDRSVDLVDRGTASRDVDDAGPRSSSQSSTGGRTAERN